MYTTRLSFLHSNLKKKNNLKKGVFCVYTICFKCFYLYKIKSDRYSIEESLQDEQINIQSYSDLLNYKQDDSRISRQKVLSDATFRFSREDTLFTIHNNSQLYALSWLSKMGAKYTRLNFTNEKNSVVIDCMKLDMQLIDLDHMKKLIDAMLKKSFSENAQKAFIFIPKSKETQDRIEMIKKMGFEKN